MSKRIKADLALLLVTVVWGSSYIFSKLIFASGIREFNVIALRFGIAFILSAVIFWKKLRFIDAKAVKRAAMLGLVMFVNYGFLMYGVNRTSAANAAFVNSLSIVIVPMLTVFLSKKLPSSNEIVGAILAVIGVGLITINSSLAFGMGEFICLFSAAFEAIHIILTARLVKDSEPISVGTLQLGFIGLFASIASLIFGTPVIPDSTGIWVSVIYLGVFSSALPILVQTKVQKHTKSTHTAIIFSTEPVYTTIFSFLVYGSTLPVRRTIGVFIVMIGMVNTVIGFGNILCKLKRPLARNNRSKKKARA